MQDCRREIAAANHDDIVNSGGHFHSRDSREQRMSQWRTYVILILQ